MPSLTDPSSSPAADDVSAGTPGALQPSPPSAPNVDASLDTSADSNDALEGENEPDSVYVASSPKAEMTLASVSRFAPFEESYTDMNELRRALKVLSVQRNAPYYMQHSSPQRVEARCPSWRQRKRRAGADSDAEVSTAAAPVCEFVVSANRHANGRVYVTRAVVTHSPTCSVLHARLAANADAANTGESGTAGEKGRVSSTVTASALLETALPFMGELASSRGGRDAVKPKDISNIMKEKFGVQPSYMTAWRALSAFRQQRKQDDSKSYMKLNGYLQSFAETNAGSLVAFEHQDSSQVPPPVGKPNAKIFARAFLCPKPLHDALRYCRGSMLLSVFLVTSPFGGVVFTATGQDAMGDNVPIAIGLAPAESENAWSFFLQNLRRAFPDLERSVTSLVHNRGDELTRAAHNVFPNCPQSNEVEMFIRNGVQAAAAAAASEASSVPSATPGAIGATLPLDLSMQWMEALCAKSPLMILAGWVSQVARTLFQRYERYGHLSSEYPAEFHSLAAEYEGEASRFDVVRTSESEFEVIDQQTSAGRVVNFAKQTCTCGEYDVSRFPCLHVFLAVTHAGMLQTEVIPRIFLMTSLKALYAGRITPIDIDTVTSDGVTIPQPLPKTRGRPRKVQQIQQFGDPKQEKLSCSVCGVKGHNKRTCKRLSSVSIPIARGTSVSEVHTDDVATGQEDTTFLVSPYGDDLAFDNSALGGAEGHVSDGHLSSGKRRRLTANDNGEEKKVGDDDEEAGANGVALYILERANEYIAMNYFPFQHEVQQKRSYNVPFSVKENAWYPVEIRVSSSAGNITFSIDGQQVFDIVLTEMGFTDSQLSFNGWASRGEGAIGFGGWQDQASFVRNVVATSLTDSSEVLYSNPMTDKSVVVPEFGGRHGRCFLRISSRR
ncbi:hypothetical protein PRNP1_000085 [Phytophthora ramorum]